MNQTEYQEITYFAHQHHNEMVSHLTQLVELETPTQSKASLDKLGSLLADELRGQGAQVDVLSQADAGDHVRARWGEGAGGVLLLGHMDTVWDLGTLGDRPMRVQGTELYGPGSLDMKGGIVIALWALRTLSCLRLWPRLPITLLLTSDEETGSRTSRPIIEAEAKKCDAVFVLEPAQPPHGSLKTWRKGVGGYRILVTGRAAHAGVDHAKGINAIEELARQILIIQDFTNYSSGTTFSVGVVGGGTRSNVIPAKAWAEVDVRVSDNAEVARVEKLMSSLKPHAAGATLEVRGRVGRPPMLRTPENAALYALAEQLALAMGFQITESGSGGGSDGNFTAALGVPTLDGMGAVGDGAHAIDEHVFTPSLPERAALLAAMLHSISDDGFPAAQSA